MYNLGSFASNETYGGLFERSLREEDLELDCHGQLHMWPTP
jgi:hypothetical protein